jgi:hypothetical protein
LVFSATPKCPFLIWRKNGHFPHCALSMKISSPKAINWTLKQYG